MLATQRESGSAIKSFAADLADFSETLRTSDGDLRKVLDNGVVASRELRTLIEREPAGDLGAAGQPADHRAGHGGPARRRGAGPRDLPRQRGRRLHGRPGRRRPRTSAWCSTATRRRARRATRGPTSARRRPPRTCRPTPTRAARSRAGPRPPSAARRTLRRRATATRASCPGAGRTGTTGTVPSFVAGPDRVRPDQRARDGGGRRAARGGVPRGTGTAFGEESWKWLLLGPLSR